GRCFLGGCGVSAAPSGFAKAGTVGVGQSAGSAWGEDGAALSPADSGAAFSRGAAASVAAEDLSGASSFPGSDRAPSVRTGGSGSGGTPRELAAAASDLTGGSGSGAWV